MAALRQRLEEHGEAALRSAREYASVYARRRGSMVFDVVYSRRRNYERRVRPTVQMWEQAQDSPSLATLAANPPERRTYGLMATEAETMATVARNLVALGREMGLDEDDSCRTWADQVTDLEHAPALDPVAGGVKGIGLALFAYLRMRCGADAVKPDVRVRKGPQ